MKFLHRTISFWTLNQKISHLNDQKQANQLEGTETSMTELTSLISKIRKWNSNSFMNTTSGKPTRKLGTPSLSETKIPGLFGRDNKTQQPST